MTFDLELRAARLCSALHEAKTLLHEQLVAGLRAGGTTEV
jgi:hypothetical protein